MIRPLLLAFCLLTTAALRAQTRDSLAATGRPAARCKLGLKLGSGVGYINSREAPPTWTAYTGGLSLAYRPNRPNFFSTVQVDVLLERRTARPWQGSNTNNATLFVPVYLRTDPDNAWFHLLVGAGPTVWLAGRQVPGDQHATYATHPVEATLLTGIEVRVLPLGRLETTLAFTYRFSLTPDLVRRTTSPSGIVTTDEYKHRWLGGTLNVYLHPRPRA
jgi:hypothetical protein